MSYNFSPSMIDFQLEDSGLDVYMYTERLRLEAIKPGHTDDCVELFGSEKVMEKFAERKPRSKESVVSRINDSWLKRWKQNDPFSAFSIFRIDDDNYIGNIIVGYGDKPGQSEMARLLKHRFWKNGYGTESAGAMIYGFAPEVIQRGYLLEGKPLSQITATSTIDNIGSWKSLEKVGMHKVDSIKKYDIEKLVYAIDMSTLSSFQK